MTVRILICDKIEAVCPDLFRSAGFEVTEKSGQSPEELVKAAPEYEALVVRSATKVTAQILASGAGGRLKIVGRAGAGVDNIDMVAAASHNVRVVNTPGLNANAVAELTMAFFIMLSRHIGPAISSLKDGRWEKKGLEGFELSGRKVGLVGFGSVGKLVGQKAKALGMEVLAYDPLLTGEIIQKGGASSVTLDELWAKSDYISLHLPKTKETVNLVNEDVLSRLKKTAYLVNCARGGLVDEQALYQALAGGRLAGAAFDVFATEPPENNPLLQLHNFIATPHLGASTLEAQLGVARRVAELIIDYLKSGAAV